MMKPDPWGQYARLQKMLMADGISDRSWAIEEAMNLVIFEATRGHPITDEQITNLLTNRRAKYRRRRQVDATEFIPQQIHGERAALARIELRARLTRCPQRDQSILLQVGSGYGSREIGVTQGVPEGTIKTWTRRARQRFAA